jgi:hypothetical protein
VKLFENNQKQEFIEGISNIAKDACFWKIKQIDIVVWMDVFNALDTYFSDVLS